MNPLLSRLIKNITVAKPSLFIYIMMCYVRAIDDRRCVVLRLLLLDLSAAFDTVDHEFLLHSISSKFGISGKALDWFGSYLKDHSQYVAINGIRSAMSHDLKCDVPQGAVFVAFFI